MSLKNISYNITTNDIDLLKYLFINKVASREQINRDVYIGYWPQSTRKRLFRLKQDKFISAKRPISTWKDQTSLYGLTSKGLKLIAPLIKTPLLKKRLDSDSIEHDLNLVDIRRNLILKNCVKKYFTENQIHNEAKFYEDEQFKIFNQLRFDGLVEYSRDLKNKVLIPIQYERVEKSNERYKKILSVFYLESSVPAIIYITDNDKVEKKIKENERCIEPNTKDQKLFYGKLQDLSNDEKLIKFYGQGNKLIKFE